MKGGVCVLDEGCEWISECELVKVVELKKGFQLFRQGKPKKIKT